MLKPKRFLSIMVLTVLFVGSGSLAAAAMVPDERPVAEVMVGSSGINFLPKVNYQQMAITVARPDGSVFQRSFDAGSTPYLDLYSIFGNDACDGIYTYELQVTALNQAKVRENLEKAGLQQSVKPTESLTQTGHFAVQGGALISGSTEELSRVMDVVHADDVIITGSLCVGFDCLTDGSESFGYDTIKLKENSLRIYFDDTSTSAGFPANDWRIVANDSGSGGGNYLSIEDSTGGKVPFKIEAGAKTSALYVSSSGRVGLGTSTPVLNLHIRHGDTPSLRLDQDTSSGFTSQVFDIAGNETNFFVRDVTGGSTLPFRIQPGAPSNTLTLKSDGKVGIGTWSPAYPLEVETTGANAEIAVERTSGATNFISAGSSYGFFGTTTNHPLRMNVNSAWKMQLNADNSLAMASGATCTAGGVWTSVSSRNAKENIKNLSADEAIEALDGLNPVTFNYKAEKEEQYVGFIAEDVPELVASRDRTHLTPMDVVAVLTKVVQEQQKVIAELKTKVAELEKK